MKEREEGGKARQSYSKSGAIAKIVPAIRTIKQLVQSLLRHRLGWPLGMLSTDCDHLSTRTFRGQLNFMKLLEM